MTTCPLKTISHTCPERRRACRNSRTHRVFELPGFSRFHTTSRSIGVGSLALMMRISSGSSVWATRISRCLNASAQESDTCSPEPSDRGPVWSLRADHRKPWRLPEMTPCACADSTMPCVDSMQFLAVLGLARPSLTRPPDRALGWTRPYLRRRCANARSGPAEGSSSRCTNSPIRTESETAR